MTDRAPEAGRMPGWLLAGLVGLRLAAAALFPWLAARVPAWAWTNNDGYDAIARHWLATGVFSLDGIAPTAIRLPLYPALIAVLRWALGGGYVAGVILLQAGLSVATGLLLWRLARDLFGRRAAICAVALFALHPQVNQFVFRCATETLFVFLATALAWAGMRFVQDRRARHLLLAAAALGASLLTRQTLAPLAAAAGLGLLGWSAAGGRDALRRLGLTAAAAATAAVIVVPWLARNHARSGGEWVLQTWTGAPLCQGVVVTRHLDEFFAGRKTLTDLDRAGLLEVGFLTRRLQRDLPPDLPPIAAEAAADRYFRARAVQLLARTPGDSLKRIARNLVWAPVLQMTWSSTRVLMAVNGPILLLGIWGVFAWARGGGWKRSPGAWPVLALFAYLYLSHAATWPQARYLLPGFVPFLAFAGLGCDRLLVRSSAFRRRLRS